MLCDTPDCVLFFFFFVPGVIVGRFYVCRFILVSDPYFSLTFLLFFQREKKCSVYYCMYLCAYSTARLDARAAMQRWCDSFHDNNRTIQNVCGNY